VAIRVEELEGRIKALTSVNFSNCDYDEVWCVFDIDEHPFVPETKRQARDNEISTAISNPCFELWIRLHFQDRRAHIERAQVQHKCRRYLPN
jgi:hypothetical protein